MILVWILCHSFDFFCLSSFDSTYFTLRSSPSTHDSLGQGVWCMCERIYICLCVGLFVCAALHTHSHTYMCFCLNGPLWFSHGYLLVLSQQQKVKAPTSLTSLSTVVFISFPCLHVASNFPNEERDSWWDSSVAASWHVGAAGPQGPWLHLSGFSSPAETDSLGDAEMIINAKKITSDTSNKAALRPGQQTAFGIKYWETKWPFLLHHSPSWLSNKSNSFSGDF